MVVATLVHERYVFITEGFLPQPAVRGLVGILSPKCSTPLCYHSALEDAWRIHCPTLPKNNSHNWRTWRCDQFNYERALIHAGVPRTIVSSPADWGPRISPSGVTLDPKPTTTATRQLSTTSNHSNQDHDLHPFSGQQPPLTPFDPPQLDSLVGPQRAKAVYPCQRPSRGLVVRKHRTTGNKGCPYQYCQACCLKYGLGPCSKHQPKRPLATLTANPREIPLPSTSTSAAPAPAQPTSVSTSEPPRPRGPRAHQWAQSAKTLGHRLGVEAVLTIQIDLCKQYGAVQREIANKYDENKVVTIHLWLDAIAEKVISAHFDHWPKARLEESSLLMQACTQTLGTSWNRSLLFWDNKIDAWHETMVSFPHRFPASKKNLVFRFHTVNPNSPGLPQSKSKQGPVFPTTAAAQNDPVEPPASASLPVETYGLNPPQVVSSFPTSLPPDSDDNIIFVKSSLPEPTSQADDAVASQREISKPPIFDPFHVVTKIPKNTRRSKCCHPAHPVSSVDGLGPSLEEKVARFFGACVNPPRVVQGVIFSPMKLKYWGVATDEVSPNRRGGPLALPVRALEEDPWGSPPQVIIQTLCMYVKPANLDSVKDIKSASDAMRRSGTTPVNPTQAQGEGGVAWHQTETNLVLKDNKGQPILSPLKAYGLSISDDFLVRNHTYHIHGPVGVDLVDGDAFIKHSIMTQSLVATIPPQPEDLSGKAKISAIGKVL
ncbi:uncharacterized protein MELLADRAFT_105099 [Melampsora larici-populina 98AG31]|uniref:Uncharacterized protein n=1 Tax=Melampsora larici-populina (strain 98AG31 / pathotype 3-4-7) TaxID=747676 RepID=F4RH93_MELLP|nr:uncharacterized protein MELLADRAFT_105099 [Melampsora larici-populina 98AG31]EGG08369.1 hypothetical protein MELLADRAFT_105099 [Melampsora larici-populina 98AG31]